MTKHEHRYKGVRGERREERRGEERRGEEKRREGKGREEAERGNSLFHSMWKLVRKCLSISALNTEFH